MSGSNKPSNTQVKRKNTNASAVSRVKKRENDFKKTQRLLIAVIAVLALFVAALIAWNAVKGNDNLVQDGTEVHVSFSKGFIGSEYAEILYDKGLLKNKEEFNSEINSRNCVGELQAGSYVFTGGMSVSAIVDQLVAGPNTSFTIDKGDSLQEVADKIVLAYGDSVKADELMSKFTNLNEYLSDYSFLKGHDDMSGFLEPGTYKTQAFGSMEFASARANIIVREILDNYASNQQELISR